MSALPPVWAIYDHPADFPGAFVVRTWYGETPGAVKLVRTLVEARQYILASGGCVRFARSPEEDPVILESWI